MSHFYSEIHGSRGPANRAGTQASGIDGWVQGWYSRLTVSMTNSDGTDAACFRLNPGPSNYNGGSLRINFDDVDAVVNALGCGDPKIERIRQRIYTEIEKLNIEAPKAVVRTENKLKREQRQRERDELIADKARADLVRSLSSTEKARLTRALNVNWDADGNLEGSDWRVVKEANIRYGNDTTAHVIVTVRPKGAHQRYDLNVTIGIWLLPFPPEDLGIDLRNIGFGYKVVNQEENV